MGIFLFSSDVSAERYTTCPDSFPLSVHPQNVFPVVCLLASSPAVLDEACPSLIPDLGNFLACSGNGALHSLSVSPFSCVCCSTFACPSVRLFHLRSLRVSFASPLLNSGIFMPSGHNLCLLRVYVCLPGFISSTVWNVLFFSM